MILGLIIILLLGALAPAYARDSPLPVEADALVEANQLLEEELKVAARPYIYLVLDLGKPILLIKSRGLVLAQLPVTGWRQSGERAIAGVYHLRNRPAVPRPKAAPADSLAPIELEQMPDVYTLHFDPGLVVTVAPAAGERLWGWVLHVVREWWAWMASIVGWTGSTSREDGVRLHLTLSQGSAQALAWSATDRMPLIIGRTTDP